MQLFDAFPNLHKDIDVGTKVLFPASVCLNVRMEVTAVAKFKDNDMGVSALAVLNIK